MCNNKQIVIEGPDQILYQWDTGQRLQLHSCELGTRVDFTLCNQNKATSVYAYAEDGEVFCDIPDAILMEPNHIRGFVYVNDGDRGETVREFILPVIPRPKPEDYVEPEEVPTWYELEQRIKKIEDEGVPDEKIERAVGDYLEENPIEAPDVDLTGVVKSVNGAAPDENGNVEITISGSSQNGNGGISATAKNLLITILLNGVYTNDQSANIVALKNALSASGGSDSGSGDDSGDSGGDSGGDVQGFVEVIEAPGWGIRNTNHMWDEAGTMSAYFKCEPNTDYNITENGTHNRFRFYGIEAEEIVLVRDGVMSVIADKSTNSTIDNLTEITINSGNHNWVYVYLATDNSVSPNITVEEVA